MFIRRLQKDDLASRVAWMNHQSIYSSMSYAVPVTMENTVKWYHSARANVNRADFALTNANGDLLAMGGLTNIDNSSQKAELYIFVNPHFHKQGLGKKATYLICKYAFEKLHLHKVYLHTNSSNIAAQKVYEKVGFKLEGIMREERQVSNGYEDRLYYGLLASEFDYKVFPLVEINTSHLILSNISIDGQNFKIVRDDIFPYIGGGSKARKAVAYEQYLKDNGYDAVVTCGGIQSNHNRAIALMCARNGWKCHLCIQGTKERFEQEKGNAILCRLSGATCELISPCDTAVAMDKAMLQLQKSGYKPFYITGGGHDLPGGTCFVDAVFELKRQCDACGYKPDYIYLASGTGSTQAGILVGLYLVGWADVTCVGISVAREYTRGKQVIAEFANMLAAHYGIDHDFTDDVIFNTDYLCGGYEQYSNDMKTHLEEAMLNTGLIFDTTYSGKGFYGMMKEVQNCNLKDKNIVFWHTGGLMNLMK